MLTRARGLTPGTVKVAPRSRTRGERRCAKHATAWASVFLTAVPLWNVLPRPPTLLEVPGTGPLRAQAIRSHLEDAHVVVVARRPRVALDVDREPRGADEAGEAARTQLGPDRPHKNLTCLEGSLAKVVARNGICDLSSSLRSLPCLLASEQPGVPLVAALPPPRPSCLKCGSARRRGTARPTIAAPAMSRSRRVHLAEW